MPFCFYSTVTDFAKFLGLSMSHPLFLATWYANNCNGITDYIGCKNGLIFGMYII